MTKSKVLQGETFAILEEQPHEVEEITDTWHVPIFSDRRLGSRNAEL